MNLVVKGNLKRENEKRPVDAAMNRSTIQPAIHPNQPTNQLAEHASVHPSIRWKLKNALLPPPQRTPRKRDENRSRNQIYPPLFCSSRNS